MTDTEAAVRYVQALFAGNAGGHDAAHTLRVYRLAMTLAAREGGCDAETVALAALLHDADDHKLFDTEDFANARGFLRERGIGPEKAEKVVEAIRGVSFSRNRGKRPATPEGRVVQDADRLDAMGAVGIARAFAYGGEHGRALEDSLRHFDEKLLLLRDGMNTASGRELAEERHAYMEGFLSQWERELREDEGEEGRREGAPDRGKRQTADESLGAPDRMARTAGGCQEANAQ